jgi:hypothetical protein
LKVTSSSSALALNFSAHFSNIFLSLLYFLNSLRPILTSVEPSSTATL